MDEHCADYLPLLTANVGADGKRIFDKRDKRRLIEAGPRPGASVAGMVLKSGVNAKQLRRWIKKYEASLKGAAAPRDLKAVPTAFVPVVAISDNSWSASPMQPQRAPDADVTDLLPFICARRPQEKAQTGRRTECASACWATCSLITSTRTLPVDPDRRDARTLACQL
jgi:transposase